MTNRLLLTFVLCALGAQTMAKALFIDTASGTPSPVCALISLSPDPDTALCTLDNTSGSSSLVNAQNQQAFSAAADAASIFGVVSTHTLSVGLESRFTVADANLPGLPALDLVGLNPNSDEVLFVEAVLNNNGGTWDSYGLAVQTFDATGHLAAKQAIFSAFSLFPGPLSATDGLGNDISASLTPAFSNTVATLSGDMPDADNIRNSPGIGVLPSEWSLLRTPPTVASYHTSDPLLGGSQASGKVGAFLLAYKLDLSDVAIGHQVVISTAGQLKPAAAPEPGVLLMAGAGLFGVALARRRRRS